MEYFQFGSIMTKVVNTYVEVVFGHKFSFFLGKFIGVKLLRHMVSFIISVNRAYILEIKNPVVIVYYNFM